PAHSRGGRNDHKQERNRDTSHRNRSFSPPSWQSLPDQESSFRQGTRGSDGLSVCAICLGRFRHDVSKCSARVLWNGSTKSRTRRTEDGQLINPAGHSICLSWQRPNSCRRNHRDLHECSGCGQTSHGA
ncbi:hypothetical protein C8J57DRAFT_1191823, partial [Mycena rebaudengoi]